MSHAIHAHKNNRTIRHYTTWAAISIRPGNIFHKYVHKLNEDTQEGQVTEASADGRGAVEPTDVTDLSPEAQPIARVLIDTMSRT